MSCLKLCNYSLVLLQILQDAKYQLVPLVFMGRSSLFFRDEAHVASKKTSHELQSEIITCSEKQQLVAATFLAHIYILYSTVKRTHFNFIFTKKIYAKPPIYTAFINLSLARHSQTNKMLTCDQNM